MVKLTQLYNEIKLIGQFSPNSYINKDIISQFINPEPGETLLTWVRKNKCVVDFVNSTPRGRNTKIQHHYGNGTIKSNLLFNMIDWNKFREYVILTNMSKELIEKYKTILLKIRAKLLEDYFKPYFGEGRVKTGYKTTELRLHTDLPISQVKTIDNV